MSVIMKLVSVCRHAAQHRPTVLSACAGLRAPKACALLLSVSNHEDIITTAGSCNRRSPRTKRNPYRGDIELTVENHADTQLSTGRLLGVAFNMLMLIVCPLQKGGILLKDLL
jgi:hypothetical protein